MSQSGHDGTGASRPAERAAVTMERASRGIRARSSVGSMGLSCSLEQWERCVAEFDLRPGAGLLVS